MNQIFYTMKDSKNYVVYLPTKGALTLTNEHPNFDKISSMLIKGVDVQDEDKILELLDVKKVIEFTSDGKLSVKEGLVYYEDRLIENVLSERLLKMLSISKEGAMPLVRFIENLMQNPSKTSVDELYNFLNVNDLPLTEDGCFLAYKKVSYDFFDLKTGTFDNSIGSVCEMARNEVDDDSNKTCSTGLHFCSKSYLAHYGGDGDDDFDDKIVIVKINPADVVAFPKDYNNAKGRCCRYEVVDVIKSFESLPCFYSDMEIDIERVNMYADIKTYFKNEWNLKIKLKKSFGRVFTLADRALINASMFDRYGLEFFNNEGSTNVMDYVDQVFYNFKSIKDFEVKSGE